jgi:hypothetical protein
MVIGSNPLERPGTRGLKKNRKRPPFVSEPEETPFGLDRMGVSYINNITYFTASGRKGDF